MKRYIVVNREARLYDGVDYYAALAERSANTLEERRQRQALELGNDSQSANFLAREWKPRSVTQSVLDEADAIPVLRPARSNRPIDLILISLTSAATSWHSAFTSSGLIPW
jgi:hypothetical protein